MKIVIGLGNPGVKYESTRHNIGFKVIDKLAEKYKVLSWQKKFKAEIAALNFNGEKVVLVKPQTYMNLSGEAVRDVIGWYKEDIAELIVIYDDLDLPVGKLRIRYRGSAGGHKGMLSILGNVEGADQGFTRIRLGIGRPDKGWQVVDWVLSSFKEEEKQAITEMVETAAKAVEALWCENVKVVMGKFNISNEKVV